MKQNIIPFPNSPGRQTHDRFLSRIQGIIQSRYGLNVDHQQHYELMPSLKGQLQQMSTLIDDDNLYLPIHFSGELKSVLIVNGTDSINIETRNGLIELLKTTAIPYFEHIHRSESVATQEFHYHGQLAKPDNDIISLKNKTESEFSKQWDWKSETIETRPVPIILVADEVESLRKAAFELHHVSPRLVFLNFSDIDADQRIQPEKIAELNECTIFIEDLTALAPQERGALFRYLQTNPDFEEGPAIYLGTTKLVEDLTRELRLTPEEKRLFPRFQLNLKGMSAGPDLGKNIKTFIQYSSMNLYV